MTGGTGVLGGALTARLRERADVVVLSRSAHDGPGYARGDLETGEGLADALADVDAVAHCATAADYRHPDRDVAATRNLLAAAGDRHLVYISIVGVDRIPFGYYRSKLAAEGLVETSGAPWTILRTTQFHDLVATGLRLMSRLPAPLVPTLAVQPVDVGEVADRMATLVLGEPAGRVPDMGGPRVERVPDLMRAYLGAVGSRRPTFAVPFLVPGAAAAAFRRGHHLAPAHADGTRTFADHLRTTVVARGSVAASDNRSDH
ncbi:NAD(P)H-binding protein [Actinocatenispora rupis]|uniref:Nucleotide-diphosphate-sugar epimerase n=1 Tax=Actinocatenispora rupis TaxID=519421 RepID=A0A8J3JGI2_9ACTN|nr:nucleotide-diphosphate-sugar epimerase [Actinocatenispora rupis]